MSFIDEDERYEHSHIILRHWLKQDRKYKRTEPFHSERKCEDKTTCPVHARYVRTRTT